MSDPFIPLGRLFMLIFVPVMLLFPLVFAALVPNRTADDSARIKARGMMLTLAMSTAVLLAIWVGLVLTGLRFNFAMIIAKLNRSPVRTSPTQIASSTAVLIARVSIIPRALMRAESSAVRFGTSAANTSGKSSITGTKMSMNKRPSGMKGSDMMGLLCG